MKGIQNYPEGSFCEVRRHQASEGKLADPGRDAGMTVKLLCIIT